MNEQSMPTREAVENVAAFEETGPGAERLALLWGLIAQAEAARPELDALFGHITALRASFG